MPRRSRPAKNVPRVRPPATPRLIVRNLTGTFPTSRPPTAAWRNVRPGEIHPIVTESGAGTSALMQLVFSVYPPR